MRTTSVRNFEETRGESKRLVGESTRVIVGRMKREEEGVGDRTVCVILGIDIGGLLYSMFVFGWLGLVTLPTGGLAILIFSFMRPRISSGAEGQGRIS